MPKKDYVVGAFIKNPTEINVPDEYIDRYRKFKQQEAVLEGLLLGNFVDGEYVVPDEIKRNLVLRQKIVTEWIDNGVRADLLVEGVSYHMELEIQSFDENQDIAYLYLVEKYEDQPLKTYIADYISEKSDLFRDEAMIALHIVIEGDETDKHEDDELLRRIIELKRKNSADRRFVVEMYSELYVLRMLKLLASCGDIGKKILEEYSEAIKKFGYPGKVVPELYIKLRRILDTCIKNNGGIEAIVVLNPQVKHAMKELVTSVDYFDKVTSEPVLGAKKEATEKKTEKKTEEKTTSSSKPKKADGKSKSKPKKEDGKKKPAKKAEKPPIKGQYTGEPKPSKESDKPSKRDSRKPEPAKPPRTSATSRTPTPRPEPVVPQAEKPLSPDELDKMDNNFNDDQVIENLEENYDSPKGLVGDGGNGYIDEKKDKPCDISIEQYDTENYENIYGITENKDKPNVNDEGMER